MDKSFWVFRFRGLDYSEVTVILDWCKSAIGEYPTCGLPQSGFWSPYKRSLEELVYSGVGWWWGVGEYSDPVSGDEILEHNFFIQSDEVAMRFLLMNFPGYILHAKDTVL